MHTNKTTLLFIGDSVTDCNRLEDTQEQLGQGYVRLIAEHFAANSPAIEVINRGISGNRVTDLRTRWTEDCLDIEPELVSILVGINDTWRRYDSNDPSTAEDFEANYRYLITTLLAAHPGVKIVLIEPFLLPANQEQELWFEDLNPKLAVVHKLAAEFNTILVPALEHLSKVVEEVGVETIAPDGVHPSELGHRNLADLWIKTVENP